MAERQKYSREFKLEAVRLLGAGQKPAAELARELGVPRNKLYRWQKELAQAGAEAFPGKGNHGAASREMDQLRQENLQLKEENEILKKAATYFARELK
jgi:transposase